MTEAWSSCRASRFEASEVVGKLVRASRKTNQKKLDPRTKAPVKYTLPDMASSAGIRLTGISAEAYTSIWRITLRPALSTTGSILTPAASYSSRYIQAMAWKWGNCQKKTIRKRKIASGSTRPRIAVHPKSGGMAPGKAPTKVEIGETRLSGV